jgi:hypothetical protein
VAPLALTDDRPAPQAPLDLHEGITDPAAGGCPRWPEHWRLLSSNGELVRGRCRATNLCAYCARIAAVENAELLALDALAGTAPEVWVVLTTRSTEPDPAAFYRSRDALVKAMRRRWPSLEWAALVEFTTGYGPRSGGRRRPHWNLLLKGIPVAALAQLEEVVCRVWCSRVDARPDAQFVGQVAEVGGLLRYIALHFQKEAQSPPPGWRGHRFLHSRGYLATSTPEARENARTALRFKRELWRAIRAGLAGPDVEAAAQRAMAIADATTWRMFSVDPAHPPGAPGRGQVAARGTASAAVEPPGALPCPAPSPAHRPADPAGVRTPPASAGAGAGA